MNGQKDISPFLEGITEDMVTVLDQERTNGDGWDYYSNGRILHATVYQNEISGIIRDITEDIRVKVSIDEKELSFKCDCNIKEDVCKHTVALLFAWVFDNSEFNNLTVTINELKELDKDQLVEILERLLLHEPQIAQFVKPRNLMDVSDLLDEDA